MRPRCRDKALNMANTFKNTTKDNWHQVLAKKLIIFHARTINQRWNCKHVLDYLKWITCKHTFILFDLISIFFVFFFLFSFLKMKWICGRGRRRAALATLVKTPDAIRNHALAARMRGRVSAANGCPIAAPSADFSTSATTVSQLLNNPLREWFPSDLFLKNFFYFIFFF